MTNNDESFRKPTQEDRYHWARLHCIGNMLMGLSFAKSKGYNVKDFTKFVEANIGDWETCKDNPKKLLRDFAPIIEYLAGEEIVNITISEKRCSARYRCYVEQEPFINWMKNFKIEKGDACAWCNAVDRALQRMTNLEVKNTPDNDYCVIEIIKLKKS